MERHRCGVCRGEAKVGWLRKGLGGAECGVRAAAQLCTCAQIEELVTSGVGMVCEGVIVSQSEIVSQMWL